MDAEDIRTAAERIRHVEARIAEWQGLGHDTASMVSQVNFAKTALEQGRTLDVLAICEEVLLSGKRLIGGGFPKQVRTDRVTKPAEPQTEATAAVKPPAAAPASNESYPSGLYAAPSTEALDRHRLTEEIRQAVQSDLMPKALSANQLQERIQQVVSKALEQRLGTLKQEIEEHFQRLAAGPETKAFSKPGPDLLAELDQRLGTLKQELDERFQRLSAAPETTVFAKPVPDVLAEVEKRMEARSAGIARSNAQAINQAITEATSGLEARIEELADPERLRSTVGAMIDNALRDGLAALDLKHQESAARRAVAAPGEEELHDTTLGRVVSSLAALEEGLGGRIAAAVSEAVARSEATLSTQIATTLDGFGTAIDSAVANHVSEAIAGTTEAIAGPVRELVSEALAKSAPPDLDALAQRLGKELRADLDWQVERLAAERGWVSLADVQSELTRNGTPTTQPGSGGFARLEAALVEFVHQTQSQQQQFLNVLQQRVEQGTAVVAQNLARVMAGDKHASSTVFRAKTGEGQPADHQALEARPAMSDTELDVLSKSAQFRAISTLETLTNTSTVLPGTQVTRREMPSLPITPPASAAIPAPAPDVTGDNIATATTARPVEAAGSFDTHHNVQELAPVSRTESAADLSETTDQDEAEAAGDFPSTASIPAVRVPTGTTALTGTITPSAGGSATRAAVGESSTARLAATPAQSEAFSQPATHALLPQGTADHQPTASSPATHGTATQTPAQPRQVTASVAATATHTGRIGALESGLRALVRSEVDRQLAGGLKDSLRVALGLENPPVSTASVAHQVQEAVGKALSEHAAATATPPPQGLDRDDLMRLLKDPAVRQQVLSIVAVEAVANPGALGELTGIRAFIRHEVRNAGLQDPASPAVPDAQTQQHEHALTDPGPT